MLNPVAFGDRAASIAGSATRVSSLGPYLPGSPIIATGLKRLLPGYNGPAINVSVGAFNTEVHFRGETDSLDTDALLRKVGTGAMLYVNKVYDQTGRGNHLGSGAAVLSTSSIHPRVGTPYFNGVIWVTPVLGLSCDISGFPTISSGIDSRGALNDYLFKSTATSPTINRQTASAFLSGRPRTSILRSALFGVDHVAGTDFNLYLPNGRRCEPNGELLSRCQ